MGRNNKIVNKIIKYNFLYFKIFSGRNPVSEIFSGRNPIFSASVLFLFVTFILAYTGQNYILSLWSECENRVWGVSKTSLDVTEQCATKQSCYASFLFCLPCVDLARVR